MQQQPIEFFSELPEGSFPTCAIEIVQFLDPDGAEKCAVRIQTSGRSNVLAQLGMLEYAKPVVLEGNET